MPAIMVHSGGLYSIACDARDRAIAAAKIESRNPTSDTIATVILAAAAVEAFINELPEAVEMHGARLPFVEHLDALVDVLAEIEDSRGTIKLKFLMASQVMTGRAFDKGANPFQDFAILIALRNDIMHLKPKNLVGNDDRTPVKPSAMMASLQQRKLARVAEEGHVISWFDMIQTPEMAAWACGSALAIILAVLDILPTPANPHIDPAYTMKKVFAPFRGE